MATVIDALVITLGLDPKGVQKGMTEAEKTVTGGMGKITSIIKSFAAPLAGAFAAGKLFNDWLKGADALGKFSASVGQNIEDMGAWREAVIRAGGTADGFTSSFEALNSRVAMAGAIGSGRGKKVFEQLGIALKDASGQMRDTKDILLDLADAAQKMDKAQFVGLARMLGLDAGTIRALQQGRAALEETIKYQKELGVYTEADARITADFNDRMADFRQALGAASASVFRVFVPALTAAFRYINQFIVFLRKHEKAVQSFFVILAAGITAYALPALAKLAAAAATNPFTLMIAGAAALAIALEDLYTWATGGKAAFGDFWAQFGTPEEVKAGLDNLLETLKSVGKWLIDAGAAAIQFARDFAPIIMAVLTFVGTVKALILLEKAFFAIKAAIAAVQGAMLLLNGTLLATPVGWIIAAVVALIAVLYLLYKNWDRIKEGAAKAWSAVKEYAADAWQKIKDIFGGIGAWFAAKFEAAGEAIVKPFAAAFNFIGGAVRRAKDWIKTAFAGGGEPVENALKGIISIAGRAFTPIKDVIGRIVDFTATVGQKAVGTAARIWGAAANAAAKAWEAMRGGAADAWSGISAGAERAWSAILGAAADAWSGISGAASEAWSAITGAAASVWNAIAGAASEAGSRIAGALSAAWESISAAAAGAWQNITAFCAEVWANIKGIFSGAADFFAGIFNAAADAIIGPFVRAFNFIGEKWQGLKNMLGGGANVAAKMDITAPQGAVAGAAGKQAERPTNAPRRGNIPVAVALSGNAGQSVRPSAVNNNRSGNNNRHDTRVSVEKVEVVTQATDAKGIARDIGGGLQRDLSARYSANQAEAGVIQ